MIGIPFAEFRKPVTGWISGRHGKPSLFSHPSVGFFAFLSRACCSNISSLGMIRSPFVICRNWVLCVAGGNWKKGQWFN